MAKLYVGKGKGRQGFAEYVMPAAWLRRFARKGRMRAATEAEAARYALAETKRPVRLADLPALPAVGGAVSAAEVIADLESARALLLGAADEDADEDENENDAL